MKARDIMTHPVRTVGEDCTLEDAARCMLAHNIGCLPVTNSDGKLAGILTESDFAAKEKGIPFSLYRFPQVFGDWLPKQGVEKMYAAARSRQVSEFMSRAVACVDVEDGLEIVLTKMQKTGFHRLPVVSGGLPVGIIARHDLLRLMVASGGLPMISAEGEKK
ncbi:MAG: CBS domain-containing protein [Bryobacteraceae bacterium]|nr:CBS domain-containing protein [Bryobacteraceae bacterium]